MIKTLTGTQNIMNSCKTKFTNSKFSNSLSSIVISLIKFFINEINLNSNTLTQIAHPTHISSHIKVADTIKKGWPIQNP